MIAWFFRRLAAALVPHIQHAFAQEARKVLLDHSNYAKVLRIATFDIDQLRAESENNNLALAAMVRYLESQGVDWPKLRDEK